MAAQQLVNVSGGKDSTTVYSEKRCFVAVQAILEFAMRGRRFGFRVAWTMDGLPELERLRCAAMLLLEVGQVARLSEIPDVLPLGLPSSLRDDARRLLENSVSMPS